MFTKQDARNYKLISKAMTIASNAIVGRKPFANEIIIEDIFRKHFLHYNSAFLIFNTKITISDGISTSQTTDHASIKVVCRAAVESYLTYFWIFNDGDSEPSIAEFRILNWKLTSLYWRQKIQFKSAEAAAKQADELRLIERLLKDLKSTATYDGLTSEEKCKCLKKIREGRDPYKRPSWRSLLEKSGLDPYFCQIYSYYCEYSHTGSISALQIRQSHLEGTQEQLCSSSLTLNMIIAAKFTKAYCNTFQESARSLSKHEELTAIINFYTDMGIVPLSASGN